MGQFDGRAVIVTGSSNGIGRATAVKFAREGAMVTLCGRDEKTLNETMSMVLAVNGGVEKKVFIARGDICKEEVMKEIVRGTVEAFGRLDVLVNNAGGGSTNPDLENSELEGNMSNFEYTININAKSVLRLCQMAFQHLVEKKGEIVNVSSICGQPNGAVNDVIASLPYFDPVIRAAFFSPGMISTNIIQSQGIPDEAVKKLESEVASLHARVPCGRVGTPDEVADAILFLADRQRSSYIVGHLLVIDGGSSLQMPMIADFLNIFADKLGNLEPSKD
ncbi:3-oxoacyl-acyl-carrier-protein reductase [Trichostrongylus colubriformis]|uniref:3-oxoacyl-acyl-carrier-protein reductase n=1 Tax=Trichostrongylus colubriformis TaxID=6319 RepID=A0AAN8EY56_TRICO